MRTLIKNGRLIDPFNLVDQVGDLYIEDQNIAGINKAPADFHPDTTIDAKDKLVIPGLIDLSVRLREPGHEQKATIASESKAAVSNGITTLCCQPDTNPVIDTSAVVELIHKRTSRVGLARIYCVGALTSNLDSKTLANMHALKDAGCLAVGNAYSSISDNGLLLRALQYAATCDIAVHLYCEDQTLRGDGIIHEGVMSVRLGLSGIPATAETIAISNVLLLVEQTGARVHFCRISCARSIELIAAAKNRGLPVTVDVAISNLFLCEIDLADFNSLCHLRPPLRTTTDREALRVALKSGVIDAICSDHQPHDEDAKAAPFGQTEAGASTLDVFLPLCLQLVNEKVLDMIHLVSAITLKPATIAGVNTGMLQPGSPADICIIDPLTSWTVDSQSLISAGKNCPFNGWEMTGQASHTFVNGSLVFCR